MVIYVESVLAFNFLLDYLLLFGAARLAGRTVARRRLLFGAAVGGAYAAVQLFLPRSALLLLLALAVMGAAAFSGSGRAVKLTLLFFLASCGFAGVVVLLGQGTGTMTRLARGVVAADLPWGIFLIAAGLSYLLLSVVFRFGAARTGREVAEAVITYRGKTARVRLLRDTGNTLSDPATGLGVPVVISVILFIFYYIIDNMGFKMARDGVWDAWEGMWLSSVVLTPMGIFLTYKAVKDSVILNADTYVNALKNLIGKREGRKVERKEVIIYTPDYEATLPQLEKLVEESTTYLTNHKRWINYLTFWKQGGKDNTAELLAQDTENIVEELSNSDQNLLLNKLMDYPVIGGYNNKLSKHINGKLALAIGIFFPLGLPIYLLATYQRKLLRHDIVMVQKTSKELINMIYSLHLLKK